MPIVIIEAQKRQEMADKEEREMDRKEHQWCQVLSKFM